jgi:hypothetical protein
MAGEIMYAKMNSLLKFCTPLPKSGQQHIVAQAESGQYDRRLR